VETFDEVEVGPLVKVEVMALDEEEVRVLLCLCVLLSIFASR